MSSDRDSRKSHGDTLLPIVSLLCAQLLASSWHVLGKHVMAQVPYLAPISYVLLRSLVSFLLLLLAGRIHEGRISFPPLFRNDRLLQRESSLEVGLLKPSLPCTPSSSASIASGNSVGLSLSKPNSSNSLNAVFCGTAKEVQDPLPLRSPHKKHYHHRPRRKKGRRSTFRKRLAVATYSILPSLWNMMQSLLFALKLFQQRVNSLNPDAVQVISAGLSGMLLLPICYTTGLILTSPTVASVWDGPLIPLGCFCTAVTLGMEKLSKSHPVGQVGSLLLAVGGSIVVLLVDYMGGGHGIGGNDGGEAKVVGSDDGGFTDHMKFIQGNMVLAGVVAAYSATALLQKRLNHYPPITLTSWMFGAGFLGCFTLLLFDTILGGKLTGCTLSQALLQLYLALTTSPTFRYGLLYAAFFVSAVTMSIFSYASSHLESSVITLFAATQPPLTAVLEWIWEGKALGWKKLGGMACVGLGMWIFTHTKSVDKEGAKDGGRHNGNNRHESLTNSKKEQVFGNGNVHGGCGNVEVVSLNGRDHSPNLTNRKAHADV